MPQIIQGNISKGIDNCSGAARFVVCCKGQLISKGLFGVFKSANKLANLFKDFP